MRLIGTMWKATDEEERARCEALSQVGAPPPRASCSPLCDLVCGAAAAVLAAPVHS
jgi:hypothetical protein